MTEIWTVLRIEILLTALGLGLLVIGLLIPKDQQSGVGSLTAVGLAVIFLINLGQHAQQGTLFYGSYLLDPFATFFKGLFLIAALLATIASLGGGDRVGCGRRHQAEFYSLLVFATLGMVLMAAAGDVVIMYLGLELMTISFCILVAFRQQDAKSQEAGIKFILLGAMSSAILLYGLSLLYGLTGSTLLSEIAVSVFRQGMSAPWLLVLIFIIAGFAFKISAVPFHMWAPDIYEGAPTAISALLSVGSKAAAFAALLRVLLLVLPRAFSFWEILLAALCLLTIVVGNLIAIPQTNIKRLLAFSSISQAGYLLLGVIAFSPVGVGAVLFHSLLYVFSNTAAFMVACVFGQLTGSDEIKDYAGLIKRAPLLATVLLFSMLSLAGIPPMAGYVSKFYLFTAAIAGGHVWLALIAVVMSMVSVYYYLMVAKVMFIDPPLEDGMPLRVPGGMQVALVACFLVILLVGFYPGPLTNVAMGVARSFMLP